MRSHTPQKYSKQDLPELFARLRTDGDQVMDECVHYFVAESFGHWHGRAQAGMAQLL
ncbi:hypothetical protein NG895_20845 [Aeoliella sp. ICT_H6.2]|uniref:Uncharacterized protein n=1 Tax=Aeoliella straminimaris TaxID=2954799 RepID=A0A9X2FCC2_9BACT|nr:hypothetical protein [Aeoliella straminimaris]MCO6046355.1 hypothetical protein [Aeoliella straminimaris]